MTDPNAGMAVRLLSQATARLHTVNNLYRSNEALGDLPDIIDTLTNITEYLSERVSQ